MTSKDAGGCGALVHVHPGFGVHVALHPLVGPFSPPQSHCSLGNTSPSPQEAVHMPLPQVGSIVQVGEQPSYGMRLPSSHCSEPSFFPSPHLVLWHAEAGGGTAGATGGAPAPPRSPPPVALHPSPPTT